MKKIMTTLAGLAALGLAGFLIMTQPHPRPTDGFTGLTGDSARGAAVYAAAGCGSCHMADKAEGEAQLVLSGGQKFGSPFGTFLAPNISPDPDQGIGGWTLEQFATAVMDGISPDNQHYFPAMPYNAYGKMAAQDVADLKAYMDALPASKIASLPHEVGFPFNIRRSLGGWKLLFQSQEFVLQGDLTPQVARGRYIAEAMSHCGECHSPRNLLGGLKTAKWLAGAPDPSGQGKIPGIAPGILAWSEDEIFDYLTTGFTPEFDSVGGHMARVVDNMAKLPEADVRAIAAYIKAVPKQAP